MSVARQKLIAAASAVGLGLSVAAHATGSPANDSSERKPVSQRPSARDAGDQRLGVLAKPTRHFHRSLAIARRKAERAQAAHGTTPGAGVSATPESVGVSSATLDSIASCESGGDPAAVSADGTYRGKYQFDYGTWASVGGSGDPAAAPEAEQDYRAALLYSRTGSSAWPICG